MYHRISSRITTVAPKQAEACIKINTLGGQRPLKVPVVNRYALLMSTGKWTRGEIAIAHMSNGQQVLVNGQHQCHAIVQAQKPVCAVVDHYQCETDEDLLRLFGTFDMQAGRTERDVTRAARGLFASEALRAVPVNLLNACGAALLFLGDGLKPGFHAKPPDKLYRTELIQKYEADVLRVATYSAHASLLTVPVVTAMIATLRVDEPKAREFWDRVLIGDDLRRGSPQWHLHRALMGDIKLTRNQIGTNGRDRNSILYSICVKWWNAFITGSQRTAIRLNGAVPDVMGQKRSVASQLFS